MATIDPVTGAATYAPFFDSFDNGLVNFPDSWNVDLSIPGQVTLHRPEPWLNSGMLEATGSPGMGHGYGTYSVTAKLDGGVPGSAVLLWPGDNTWPGPEIDIVETLYDGSGRQYSTLHRNENGQDAFDPIWFDPAIQGGVFHDYELLWEPGRITVSVDGRQQAVFTEHVPADYAHGGMDQVFGLLNINPQTSLTVTELSYVPLGAEAPALAPQAAEVAEVVDWEALAAQVMRNYEATGTWWY